MISVKAQLSMSIIDINLKLLIGRLLILSFILFLPFNYSCGKKNEPTIKLRSICLFYKWQVVMIDRGQLGEVTDSLFIHYYEDLVLYQIPYTNQITSFIDNKNSDTINETLIKTETKFKYYIYKNGQNSGRYYDDLIDTNGKPFSVDSLLSKRSFQNLKIYNPTNDSLINTSIDNYREHFIEKYIPKIKYDQSFPDSTYLYLTTRLKDIKYSLSKELDSIKKMKLYKVMLVYNEIPEGIYPYKVPKRELLFELKKISIIDTPSIVNLLKTSQKKFNR